MLPKSASQGKTKFFVQSVRGARQHSCRAQESESRSQNPCGIFFSHNHPIVNHVILSSTSYTYDRLGRQLSAIAAGVSTNLYAYSRYGQLTNETVQGLCASAPLRETLSRAYDTLGRSTGFSVAGVGDPGSSYAVTYGYDVYGRFQSVESAQSADTFTYTYLSGSSLVSGMTASTGHAWSRSYEPHRNLISAVENTYGPAIISRFDYVNDEIGRRVSRADSGIAFDNPAFGVG